MRQQGHRVGRQARRPARRRRGLRAWPPKACSPRTPDSTQGLRGAPHRPRDQPAVVQANRGWGSDITHSPLPTGQWGVGSGQWAYLGACQEVASQHVVGWHVLATRPAELLTSAWQRALLAQQPAAGLLVQSDRTGQYCGNAYRTLLHAHQARRSLSRRDECYAKAPAENRLQVLRAAGPA